MCGPPDDVAAEPVSLRQLSPAQVAEIVNPGSGRNGRCLAEGELTPGCVVVVLGPEGISGNAALAWGLACERPLGGCCGMAAEIRGQHAADEDSLFGLAGMTYRVRDGLILDLAVRRELASGERSRGWTVGVTREW
jgi:hypothetical protein